MNSIPKWYRLDNAAKIYPATATKEDTATFRVAAIMYDEVDPVRLQTALESIIKRFPSMAVSLRKGVFWYYFVANNNNPMICEEKSSPCGAINQDKNNGFLFKVLYFRRRIALECFHAVTDGGGAFEFLKALIFEYVKMEVPGIEADSSVKLASQDVPLEELEDSYSTNYEPSLDKGKGAKEFYAQHIVGTPFRKKGLIKVTHGVLNATELNKYAKSKGATITVYLTAMMIMSIYKYNKMYVNDKRPIVISVPINLRKIFPSVTMRNYSYFINVAVKVNENTTIDKIIKQVKRQMVRGLNKDELAFQLNQNVKFEKLLAMRVVPNVIKNIILKKVRDLRGNKVVTTTITNPGIINMPKGLEDYVEHMECVIYSSNPHLINTGVCSYNNRLVISISRAIKEQEIIIDFLNSIANDAGIQIDLYSN